MNYKKYFSDELTSLKSQGLYRKFREINRDKKHFPKATERFEGSERPVEVWCSNDYLNLSQHPEVIKKSIEVIQELGTGSGEQEIFLELLHIMLTWKKNLQSCTIKNPV